MKIKAPTFADLFAETSPQLGGARRTKFLEVGAAILAVQYAAVGQRVCSETCADQPLIFFVKTSDEFLQLRARGHI